MFGFIGSFLSAAIALAESHPDITRALWAEITTLLDHQANSANAVSQDAVTALHAGIAAAAASAVTSVLARQKLQAATAKPSPTTVLPAVLKPIVAAPLGTTVVTIDSSLTGG